MSHLASLDGVTFYEVQLEFTEPFEPSSLSGDGLVLVSMLDEIEANSSPAEGLRLREQYGRIPYGAPLYTWEALTGDKAEVLYIGQTMLQRVQSRFERHATVTKLLAEYINSDHAKVYFRLCSRLDIRYEVGGQLHIRAIEHLPVD